MNPVLLSKGLSVVVHGRAPTLQSCSQGVLWRVVRDLLS